MFKRAKRELEDRYTGRNFAKCFGYFAAIGNWHPHIYSLCAFTTIHEEWEKKQGGLVSFVMSVVMRLMAGGRSPY